MGIQKVMAILPLLISSALVISLFIGDTSAEPTPKNVKNGDSYTIGCHDLGPTYTAIKMKSDETLVIACAHGDSSTDIVLPEYAHRVVYCDHDNWWVIPSSDGYMDYNSIWAIHCQTPVGHGHK